MYLQGDELVLTDIKEAKVATEFEKTLREYRSGSETGGKAAKLLVLTAVFMSVCFCGFLFAAERDDLSLDEESIFLTDTDHGDEWYDIPDQTVPSFTRARGAVADIIETRIFGGHLDLRDKVSENFPDRLAFIRAVDEARTRNSLLDMGFFINKVNETESILSVSFSWEKIYTDWDSPGHLKASGQSEFVFEKTPEGYLLKNVRGENPLL